MLRKGIGLDIGTTQTTICTVDEGILLKEPSVIAVDVDTNEVLEAGNAVGFQNVPVGSFAGFNRGVISVRTRRICTFAANAVA